MLNLYTVIECIYLIKTYEYEYIWICGTVSTSLIKSTGVTDGILDYARQRANSLT